MFLRLRFRFPRDKVDRSAGKDLAVNRRSRSFDDLDAFDIDLVDESDASKPVAQLNVCVEATNTIAGRKRLVACDIACIAELITKLERVEIIHELSGYGIHGERQIPDLARNASTRG